MIRRRTRERQQPAFQVGQHGEMGQRQVHSIDWVGDLGFGPLFGGDGWYCATELTAAEMEGGFWGED